VISGYWFTSKLVSGKGDRVLKEDNQIWYNKHGDVTYEHMSMIWGGRLRQVCTLEV